MVIFRNKSWLYFSQVTLRNRWLHCLFTVLCLTESSAGPATRPGEARLQGSQGDEDGFLEGKCSNGLGPAALSRALRRLRTGPASVTLMICHWPDACPVKGFTSLFLGLPLCKMGMTGGMMGAYLSPRVRGGDRKFSALGIGIGKVGAGVLVGRVQLAVLQHLAPKRPLGTGGLEQSTCLVTTFETEGSRATGSVDAQDEGSEPAASWHPCGGLPCPPWSHTSVQ